MGKEEYKPGTSWLQQLVAEKCSELNGWASKTQGLLLAKEDAPRAFRRIMMSCGVLDRTLDPKTDIK